MNTYVTHVLPTPYFPQSLIHVQRAVHGERLLAYITSCPQSLIHVQRAVHGERLLAYITSCLPPTDWHRAPELAGQAWKEALVRGGMDLTLNQPGGTDPESGLPGWLASATRTVLRHHLHPTPAAPRPQLQAWELDLLQRHAVQDFPVAA